MSGWRPDASRPLDSAVAAHAFARRTLTSLVVIGVYAVGVWVLFQPLGLLDASRIPAEAASRCGCGDNGQQMWMLAVVHARLVAGHLPFFTRAVNYPAGVNLLDSASFPLLGTLMAPVTAGYGPAAALGLLVRLGVLASAASCYFVIRRLGVRPFAAAIGGALYGFSPYMVRESGAHVFLVFVPLPPIILLIVFRRVVGDVGRPFRGGLLIGALAVLQGLISIETLTATATLVVTVLVVVGVGRLVRRRPVLPSLAVIARLAFGAAVVAIPLLAFPVWYLLAGPQHIVGAPSPPGAFAVSPLATVLPGGGGVVAGLWSGWRLAPVGFTTDIAFVGIPLLVVVVWIVGRLHRCPVVGPVAVLGLVAWVAALGTHLTIGGATAVPLPFDLLVHVPLLRNMITNRFALYVDLSLAVLVAIGFDRLAARAADGRVPTALLGGVGVLASVALVLPTSTVPVAGIAGSQVVASSSGRRAIPAGAVVLGYPYPRYTKEEAMLWQAEAGVRFDLIGGYAERPLHRAQTAVFPGIGVVRSVPGEGTKSPAPLEPRAISALLLHLGPVGPRTVASAAAQLPTFARRHHVSVAVVDTSVAGEAPVVEAFDRAFGHSTRVGSLRIWSTASG